MYNNAFDQARFEAFAGRMLATLNEGSVAVMTSVGHRTGLFEALARLPAATSDEIAAAAGLAERYVREWLAVMVTGRVVEYDPDDQTYRLPAEHAAWLTSSAPVSNIAVSAQFVSLMGEIEDRIVDAFQAGGGPTYDDYPRFHDIMAEASGQSIVKALTEAILPLVPGLTEALERGIDVLDVGCGQGRALVTLAEAFPRSRFTGYDFEERALAVGRQAAAERGLTNVRFAVQDVARLAETAAYDVAFAFDAIHDQADPVGVMANVRRALRPDGLFLMQDIRGSSHLQQNLEHPAAPLFYAISTTHCMAVSLGQGGAGLGTMWGEELALAVLAEGGFGRVEVRQLSHDLFNNYYIARPTGGAASLPDWAAERLAYAVPVR
jgi:SAM-dependent methyltransferase